MTKTDNLVRIATRGSALALAQAHLVRGQCQKAFPAMQFELRIIKTSGDKLQTASLSEPVLAKGLFTKEIEDALLAGEADMAVHSLKDLPTQLPQGLALGAVLKRAEVRDVLVVRRAPGMKPMLRHLRPGATVATSSTRRAAQLKQVLPDVQVVPIRGNVDTRLRKLIEQKELDATILAAAGLQRLHIKWHRNGRLEDQREVSARPASSERLGELMAAPIRLGDMLPCVGQAAIGIEIRHGDSRMAPVMKKLNHPATRQCVECERAFLAGMGGGCQLAVAAYAVMTREGIHLRTVSFLGEKPVWAEFDGMDAHKIGREAARFFRDEQARSRAKS